MYLQERIGSFAELGKFINIYLTGSYDPEEGTYLMLEQAVGKAEAENPWFTQANIRFALSELTRTLDRKQLEQWIASYKAHELEPEAPKSVGVVMAGNIPLVGFHDLLCILTGGHLFFGKPSSRDKILLKTLSEILILINPGFASRISFTDETLPACDAIIATGSNNSQRYFEYYFGRIPHIFRKNRNGVAVLSGRESPGQLEGLADDIFLYFGLGCRSVAKIFIPQDFDFTALFAALSKYSHVADHHKYANNYTYYRAILQMNGIPHLDSGFLLIRQDEALSSPAGLLHYDWYHSLGELGKKLLAHEENLQCIVSGMALLYKTVSFGFSQKPELWEYADNVDTLKFLINLGKN
jgi:hypothetical protein